MSVKDLFLTFGKRKNVNEDKKRKIGRAALELVKPGDEIFLGAGTTVAFLAEEIARSGRHFMLRLWTNNLYIVSFWLQKYEKVFSENFVGVTAGEVSLKNLSIINLIAPFSQIEKAVIGTPGISQRGFTADDMATVQQMEFLVKRVKHLIVLAGTEKIGRECAYVTRSMRMVKLDVRNGKTYTLITNAESGNRGSHDPVLTKLGDAGFKIIKV